MDDRECFDRMLERIEELVAENHRLRDANMKETQIRRVAEEEAARLKRELEITSREAGRLERFVEGTPERTADWKSYIAPKPTTDDDIAF